MSGMDAKMYATITDLCGRLAGRLSDAQLGAVRGHYAVGEEVIAESALVAGLAYERVGVTPEELDLIRVILDNPNDPDLDAVPIIDALPPLAYRFSPTGPVGAPDPSSADVLLSTEAPLQGGRHLYRAWRDPIDGAPDGAAWAYVLQVTPGTDELLAYSGLDSQLVVTLRETWPIEVVTEGVPMYPYQAAVLATAQRIWTRV